MYYEINVSEKRKDGDYWHLFATHKRSVTTQGELKHVYTLLLKAFPFPEFKIDVVKWKERGTGINMKEPLEEK